MIPCWMLSTECGGPFVDLKPVPLYIYSPVCLGNLLYHWPLEVYLLKAGFHNSFHPFILEFFPINLVWSGQFIGQRSGTLLWKLRLENPKLFKAHSAYTETGKAHLNVNVEMKFDYYDSLVDFTTCHWDRSFQYMSCASIRVLAWSNDADVLSLSLHTNTPWHHGSIHETSWPVLFAIPVWCF